MDNNSSGDAEPSQEPMTLGPVRSIELRPGRSLEIEARGASDQLVIKGKDGLCVLSILVTDAGPVLRLEGVALELIASRSVDISCADFRLEATNELKLGAGTIDIEAHRGGVKVRASHDVALDGERVLLNSSDGPEQLTWDEFLAGR